MKREETKKIIRIMCDCYPNYKPMDLSETVDVWTMMLEEYTYEQISVALKAYILSDTNGFAPCVGQLVAKAQTITQPQELNEMEAWALVSKAIRNSGYNSVEEYEKLPPVVQKAVGLPGQLRIWAMDEHYNEEVVMSQFMRTYRTEVTRQTEFEKLPSDVQILIQNTSENSYKAQIQEKRDFVIKSSLEDKKTLKIENKSAGVPKHIEERLEEMRYENGVQ